MIKDGIEFNYKVLSIDIESAHMVIEYTPVDPELMPMTLNVLFDSYNNIYQSVGLPGDPPPPVTLEEHKDHTALAGAPTGLWKKQKILLSLL